MLLEEEGVLVIKSPLLAFPNVFWEAWTHGHI